MNKDKDSKSKESTPRRKQDDKSGRQLKSLSQSEGPESWSTVESSIDTSARRRPSSWDDSDDESPDTPINFFNHNSLIYLEDSQKQGKCLPVENNDIKTQYFKNTDAVEGLSKTRNSNFEEKTCKNVVDKGEIKSKLDASDRRQSPARIRRRTKSSSTSSDVLERTVECSSSDYRENIQILTDESYKAPRYQSYSSESPSLKAALELDSNYFLDDLFTELHTNRIELLSLDEESSIGKGSQEGKILDLENCLRSNTDLLKSHRLVGTFPSPTYNPDLKTLESFEREKPISFIHKTSRKLSQILEVEETKKSQEGINLSEENGDVQLLEISPFLWTSPRKPSVDMTSPFSTLNGGEKNALCWTSIISLREKAESPALETTKMSPKNIVSWEKQREKEKPENYTKGKFCERFHNLFPYNDSDSIIFLTEKTGETQLGLNSEKQEGNNCGSLKDYEKGKHLDGIERDISWEIVEMENVNSESEKVNVKGKNSVSREKNNDSGTRQKSLKHVKTRNSDRERISKFSEETILSWSEGSTPRKRSLHSVKKVSKRERGPENGKLKRLEMESSNIQSQRLTSRSLKMEEVTSAHSSREISFLLKDEYIKQRKEETSKGSSHTTCDNLHPEIAEDQPNFLNIDLEKVCSNSSTCTESKSSSTRTFNQQEIGDLSFRTNSSDQSGISSHTSEHPKSRSSKKMKNLSDSSDHNRLRTEGSETDRRSKSQKLSSRSFKSSEAEATLAIFGNFERNIEPLVSYALSANSEERSTTVAKRKSSRTDETGPFSRNSTNSCSSGVSEASEGIENLESTTISRQRENYTFYHDVKMTVENIIPEKIKCSRSGKSEDVTKCKKGKSLGRNKGVKKEPCERRSEETMENEDFRRILFPIQTADIIQEDSKSCRKDGGTVRNTVTGEQFSEDVMTIEESEKCLGEKSSLSCSSAKLIDKELTLPIENIYYSLEKIEIDSGKSDREKERAKKEENQESDRLRRTGSLRNDTLSITCEKLGKDTLKVKYLSRETSNRTAISSLSSDTVEKHMSCNILEPGGCRHTITEGSQTLNEELKNTNSKTPFQESLGHETSKASEPNFQDKFNGETWNKLIDSLETQKSGRSSENKFPGIPSLNQKVFTEHDRKETQDFFFYEPDGINKSDNFFTVSTGIIEAEGKSCLQSPKDEELNGNKCKALVPERINPLSQHSEAKIIQKSNEEKSVLKYDSKRRNFEIGEFWDGNCWNDGKSDITDSEKPQHYGDGNRERRNNWETLVLSPEDNNEEKEMKSRRHTWIELEAIVLRPNPPKKKSFSGKENCADWELNFISHNLNHSKSENGLSKMWSQQRANESENFTSTNTGSMKGSTKRKSNKDSVSNSRTKDCSEESFYKDREYQVERSYSSDESRLIYGKNSRKNFKKLDKLKFEMENRKQEKESTNLNIFLAGRKKEETLVKANNWLIIKNQEQQKEKIKKLKEKLKKCKKLNSSKEPFYIDEKATRRMPAFVPDLKFDDTGCLQNFYKRLFSICCLPSNSSAATSV